MCKEKLVKPRQDSLPNIVLIGMPGSGKSTLGRLAAQKTNKAHIDTDCLLESWWGLPLQELQNFLGLSAFLDAEAEIIQKTKISNCIISTGGSVIYREETMLSLKKNAVIVYLDASIAILEKRLTNFHSRGIAIQQGQTLTELFAERKPLYQRYCDMTLSTDASLQDCVNQLLQYINEQSQNFHV